MSRKRMEKPPCSLHMLIFCTGSISSPCNRAFSLKYMPRKASETFRFAFHQLSTACSLPCYGGEPPQCHSKVLKNQRGKRKMHFLFFKCIPFEKLISGFRGSDSQRRSMQCFRPPLFLSSLQTRAFNTLPFTS